jgi:mRNA interferase MazF
MTLSRGEVVLVPFPYAELTATKTRPALVVSGEAFVSAEGRIIVAGVTSNVVAHRNSTSYELSDWAAAGLKKPSVVTSWLATISPQLVRLRVGRLTALDLLEVEKCLKTAVEL